MGFAGGNKLRLIVLFALLAMQAAFSQALVTYRIHFYSPWKDNALRSGPTARIHMEGSGGPIANRGPAMTAEGGDWFVQSVTFNPGPPGTGDGYRNFTFHNYVPNANDQWANDTTFRYGTKDFTLDDVFFKTGFKNDVWIIPQGPGVPALITDIPPNTKVVYLYNPWPQLGAPVIKTDKVDWSNMRFPENKSRCGWYVYYMQNGDTKVSFRNLQGGELYGAGGMKDAGIIDLTASLAADNQDTVFIVPTPFPVGVPKLYTTFPTGTLGICTFDLAVTVRDFSAAHPDFEVDNRAEDAIKGTKGMILPTLNPATKKPEKNPASAYKYSTRLQDWFNTTTGQTPALTNYESCYDLPISKSLDGYWQYSSLDELTTGFFPLGLNKDSKFPTDPNHQNCYTTDIDAKSCMGAPADKPEAVAFQNFNFCMEMHANFKYEKGQKFNFIGDDDVWVFINNKLVIDIGGAHWPIKDSVSLDTIPGITAGQKYDFDLFYCERQFSGSNLLIKTSIYFEQKQSIEAVPIVGSNPPAWDIKENTCGDKSCGAALTASDTCKVIPGVSTYSLSGGGLTAPETLTGTSHGGGIVVDGTKTKITVDTSKITDLAPGVYRITYTSVQSKRAGFIEFEITGSWLVDFVTKTGPDALVGTPVGATVRAKINDKPDLAGQDFVLTPVAGLNVFEDSAMTKPVTAGTVLKTDATGTRKIWVTAAAKGTYTVTVKGTKARASDTFTVGYFEIVAATTPVANPPGKTFSAPITVVLTSGTPGGATILYTNDGSAPDSALGGTTKTFTGPIAVDKSMTIKAIAIKTGYYKSGVMTESYVYARPANVKHAYYQDLNGDGRIETVIVDYDADIAVVPDKLSFKVGAPADQELTARNDQGEIAFAAGSKSRIVVTFKAKTFPFGVTSVADPATSGHQFPQDNIPLLDGAFPVDDSVPPVIVSAVVKAPDSTQPYVKVLITFSEAIAEIPAASQTAFTFKRDAAEMADVKLAGISGSGRLFVLAVDSTSPKFPIVGDSATVSGSGEVKDPAGNSPSKKAFVALTGDVPKGKPATVYITFANGSKNGEGQGGPEPTTAPDVVFIPFDRNGTALGGNPQDGKYPGAFVGSEGKFVGTVIYMEVPGAVEFNFKIFSNLGGFVATGKGKITEADLPLLTPIHNGTAYMARIVWTGRTSDGLKAGTGAYILVSTIKTEKNFKTGAPPATETNRIRFGLLRSYRGS
jgi:fibro-slime domain-containing protein